MNQEHQYWKKVGEYFGYPQCCINNFISRGPANNYYCDSNQEKVHKNQGFVPCPSCAKRIVKGEIKIEDLIKNRLHPEPYPKDSLRIFKKYIKSQINS